MAAHGWEIVPSGEFADAVIVNTCAVTVEAERKGRQMIHRALKDNPGCFLAVTGCSAQLSASALSAVPGVAVVVGNRRKMAAVEAVLSHFAKESGAQDKKTCPRPADQDRNADPDKKSTSSLPDETEASAGAPLKAQVCSLVGAPFEPMRIQKSERTRAYIKIEDGCESKCAYCAIRLARGGIRSKPAEEVVTEAAGLLAAGYRELVLTGIEISAYGKDLGYGLTDLLARLDALPFSFRLRLGSLDPAFLKPPIIASLASLSHLAHHFHLSLQSGCDKTLAAMRRTSNTAMIKRAVEGIRAAMPDASFTADVIVGFPGESEEDFEESAGFIASLGLLDFHIFAFSPRPDTEAATMPKQCSGPVKAAREKKLAALRAASTAKVLASWVGQALPVLFESWADGVAVGHTANFMEVAVSSPTPLDNALLSVGFLSVSKGRLIGRIEEKEKSPA